MNTKPHPTPHLTNAAASDETTRSTGSGRRRLAVNITPVERGGRIAIGLAAIDHSTQHVQPPPPEARKPKTGQHGWMMIACCVPMLALAIVLVATGVVGASFIFVAVGCTAMMALMMRGMNHGAMNHEGHTGAGTNDHDRMDHGGSRPLPPPSRPVRGGPDHR